MQDMDKINGVKLGYIDSYRASMWLFARMSSNMHNQHILSFEWLFFPWTIIPFAHKEFFVLSNMILIKMLKNKQKNYVSLGPFAKHTFYTLF